MPTPPFAAAQRFLFAACLAVALCWLPLPASAQTPPPAPEKTVSIDVFNADLRAVVSTLERQTHVRVRVQDGKTPFKPVYVHLDDAPLAKALRFIAQSAGASVTKNADGVYVFTPADGSTLPASPLPPEAGPQQVQIQVTFVPASLNAIDNMGLKFETIPAAPSDVSHTSLKIASGEAVAKAYQTLIRTPGCVVQAPLLTTTDKISVTISLNSPLLWTSPPPRNFIPVNASLTITPRLNPYGSVTLGIQAPNIVTGDAQTNPDLSFPLVIRTVASGETMVLCSPFTDKKFADKNMLIFLTPTIISESNDHSRADANGGQSVTVTP